MTVYYKIFNKEESIKKYNLNKDITNTNLSKYLLNIILNKCLNVSSEIDFSKYILKEDLGKLYFKEYILENGINLKDIYFNYSHNSEYIAIAICKGHSVGIDIENSNRKISNKVAIRYLKEFDKLKIENYENDDNINTNINTDINKIILWTKKEAYSKLKGLGIQIGFDNLDIIKLEKTENISYILINKDNYICSIYVDSRNINFKEINI